MRSFVSGVLILAVVAFSWTMYDNWDLDFASCFTAACERATTVLAAACPCGIGLATPSAAMAGVGKSSFFSCMPVLSLQSIDAAYAYGVLLSGGIETMESLQRATHIVMDKTGTLTEGRLSVISCHFDEGLKMSKQLCYRLLAAAEVEDARVHPVAKAVFKWALSSSQQDEKTLKPDTIAKVRNITQVPGKGVQCEVNSQRDAWIPVHIGTPAFLAENGVAIPLSGKEDNVDISRVHFAFDKRYAGHLCVQVRLRLPCATLNAKQCDSG